MVPVRVGIPRRRGGWGRGGVEGRPVCEEDVSGHDGGSGSWWTRRGTSISYIHAWGCEIGWARRSGRRVRCREIKHEAWQQTRIWDARERLGGLTRECAADGGADGWAGED